jgi:hypothetical protein
VGKPTNPAESDFPTLVGEIVREAGRLVGQQVELARAEVGSELERAAGGAAMVAGGAGMVAAGGLMAGPMLAHRLHRVTGLPLWACYGAVGGGLVAGGAALARAGRDRVAGVRLFPPQTVSAARENVVWLTEQLTPTRS